MPGADCPIVIRQVLTGLVLALLLDSAIAQDIQTLELMFDPAIVEPGQTLCFARRYAGAPFVGELVEGADDETLVIPGWSGEPDIHRVFIENDRRHILVPYCKTYGKEISECSAEGPGGKYIPLVIEVRSQPGVYVIERRTPEVQLANPDRGLVGLDCENSGLEALTLKGRVSTIYFYPLNEDDAIKISIANAPIGEYSPKILDSLIEKDGGVIAIEDQLQRPESNSVFAMRFISDDREERSIVLVSKYPIDRAAPEGD